jgi:DNA-binding NarL/FixJ family response regulator
MTDSLVRPAATTSAASAASTIAAPALRVFLVEDSPVLRDLITEDLATIPGIELSGIAETEAEALSKLQNNAFDVIIFDIQLREGNGINLLRVLAREAVQPDAVKIVLSNHVGSTYRRLCEQYDVPYFFDKTAEFGLLHSLLLRLSQRQA